MAEIAASVPGTGHPLPPPRGARRNWIPYALLVPGLLWLFVFFVVPMITLGSQSLQEGDVDNGYVFTGNVSMYGDALRAYWPQLLRSLGYAASATVLTLVLGYPLAYFIASRKGRSAFASRRARSAMAAAPKAVGASGTGSTGSGVSGTGPASRFATS